MSATFVKSVQFTTRAAEMSYPGHQWQEGLRLYLEEAAKGPPQGEGSRSFFRMQTDQGEVEIYFHPGDPNLHMSMFPFSRMRE